jgi:hypothetical protein
MSAIVVGLFLRDAVIKLVTPAVSYCRFAINYRTLYQFNIPLFDKK